jgi:hypothetical protein
MSFFKLSNGQLAQGNPEDAFIPELTIIPNNSRALAVIEKLETKQYQNEQYQDEHYYQITWKILNAPLANRIVQQKFYINSDNTNKADRAKEMFMLLHKLTQLPTNYGESGPQEHDYIKFRGKVCGLLIREWQMNGKEGNFVSELHPSKDFVEAIGTKLPAKIASSNLGASNNFDERNPPFVDNDIPNLF